MLETLQCLRTRSNIIEIKKINNNTIAIGTLHHGVKVFDYTTCQSNQTIEHEQLNTSTSALSFSPNAEFLVLYTKPYLHILHIASQIILKTIKIEEEEIEYLEFDLESKYIIASTLNGRIMQYRYDGSSLIGRLYSFEQTDKTNTNKTSSFAFYKNIMACGGSNGTLFCINLHSRANKIIIQNATHKINSLCFLNVNHIISGDENGDLYLNSLKNNTLILKQETLFTEIKNILLTPNQKYLIVSGNEKYVAVYNANSLKLLHTKYIEFTSIPRKIIVADDETLIAVLENNSIEKIKLQNANRLDSLIATKMFDKAYHLIQQNPLLKDTPEYSSLEQAYNKIYASAFEALVKQNKDGALKLTNIFKYVDEKQADIQLLYKSFEHYPRFKTLFSEKKYALAYAMSNKFPPLMKTFQYTKMEDIWNETLINAKRQMRYGKNENAVALLNEFATVTQKRPLIKLILNHNNDYTLFLKSIASKNFKIIAKMSKENPLFTFLSEYQKLEDEMQKSLKKIQKNIYRCELDLAVKELSKLQNIDSISKEVALQKDECKALKKLQDAYKANNFNKCYETIDTHNTLNSTQLGRLLQEHWLKTISQCEIFALKGSVKDIKETLGDLIHLSSRTDKIGDLFRLAFHTKIKGLIHKQLYKKAEAIIYSYIDIFDLDKELMSIMKTYESKSKTKLAITPNSHYDRDKWLNSPMIMQ